jgi:Na+/proline symporter
VTSLDLWIVAGYLAATLAVGIALARRASGSLEDFFVGGRSLPWWLAGTSMAATTFSIDTPLYVAGVVGTRGIAGNWEWWSFGVAHVVLLYVFARLWRRAEVVTDNELSELRYGGRPAALLRGVKGFLFAGVLGPITMGLSMLAMVKVVDALGVLPALGLSGAQDRLWVVTGVSALVLVYSGISGLWGVVVTDFVQFVLGMAGALLVAFAAVSHLGGLDELVAAAAAVEGRDLLAFTPLTWGDGGRVIWSSMAGISASTFFAYVGLQWWAFRRSDGGGEFVQRLAAAKTEAEAQKAAWLFNLLHYVVRTWPWIIVALAAVVLYPDMADPELGYPRLMLDFLPAGILGLVVASLVAAFMSTVSTTINWSASYLTHDLYIRFARPQASSKERLAAARLASVLVTGLGAAAAFYSENVTTLFRLIIAVGTGPGLVLILRWFWWRVNAWSELAAMVAGFLVGLGTSVVPVLTISDFGLRLLVTAAVTTAVWVPVMLLTAPETPERLDTFYRKVRPGGPGWVAQRRRTGVEPDGSLLGDLERVAAGLLILFGAMFAVGGLVLLRPGTAAGSALAVVLGTVLLRRANARRALGASAVMLLLFGGMPSSAAAQLIELEVGEGAGQSLSSWLAVRFPGVQVLGSSGMPGSAPRLRLRGPGSLSLSNEPVVMLDGMRLEADPRSTSLSVGGQAPSRLDDVAVTSLARVEVLRGPVAAAMYGAGAGAGVILLTSRGAAIGAGARLPLSPGREARRALGPGRGLSSWVTMGRVMDVAERPSNWFGRDGTGACFAFEVALNRCEQTALQVYSPLAAAESTPFGSGATWGIGARGTTRIGATDLQVGGSYDADEGVLQLPDFEAASGAPAPSGLERAGADLGLRFPLGRRTEARAWASLARSSVARVFDGNDFAGLSASGLLGLAEGGVEADYGYRLFRPSQVYGREVEQRLTRYTTGIAIESQLSALLHLELRAGLDRADRDDRQMVPPGLVDLGAELPRGIADDDHTSLSQRSARIALTADWDRHGTVHASTRLAAEIWSLEFDRDDRHGVGLPPGGGVDDAVDISLLSLAGERRLAAVGVIQSVELGATAQLRVGARLESNRTLDRTLDHAVLPFASLDVRPDLGGPAAKWWPDGLGVGLAWGRGVAVPIDDGRGLDRVALSPDADAPPLERTEGWEAGLRWVSNEGLTSLAVTRYHRTTDDLLLRTPLLSSQAAEGARYDPIGTVENRGWEIDASVALARGRRVDWTMSMMAGFNHNEVGRLGRLPGGAAPAEVRQGVQWSVPGFPLGGYWDRPLSWGDRDGDGMLVPSEINVATEEAYLGSPHPTREMGLSSRVRVGSWSLAARLLHRGGHHLRNLTEGYRCQVTLCRGFNDPSAPLAEQARAQAVAIFPADFETEAGFIEDASFWRLADASLSWRVPRGGARPSGLRFTLAGSNLALWTDYSGMDPEVNQFGAVSVLSRDFMTQPPVRRWSVRVDVNGPSW